MKAHFSAFLKATEQGPVVVTRNGKAVAMLVAVSDEEELERLRMACSPRLQAILEAARQRIQAGAGIPEKEFWAEVERDQETRKRDSRGRKRRRAARPAGAPSFPRKSVS
jgi:prevent-host-death family protein